MYCIKLFSKSIAGVLIVSAISAASILTVNAQSAVDQRVVGNWIKVGSGDRINFQANGDIELFFSGQAAPFSGNGSMGRCIEGGANLCLTGQRLQCNYRYSFTEEKLNLQFRTGSPAVACNAAAGDFRKRAD